MQGLVENPRNALTNAQVLQAMAESPSVVIDVGMDLLDSTDTVLGDLTPSLQVAGAHIDRDNTAVIQGSLACVLEPARSTINGQPWTPRWGYDRIRPWMTMDAGLGVGPVKFYLGIYLATTPGRHLNEDAPGAVAFDVTGYDKNYLLTNQIGDTYSVPSGTNIRAAVRDAIAQGSGGYLSMFLEDNASVTATDMVWPMSESEQHTWADVANELAQAGGYRPIWVDQNGFYRLENFVPVAGRLVEFYMAAGVTASSLAQYGSAAAAVAKNVVAYQDRQMALDTWNVPNHWVFVQRGLTYVPVEGGGKYTVDNLTDGPTSLNPPFGVGRVINSVQYLDAANQTALMTQGDAIVAAAKAGAESYDFQTGPLPVAGNFDIVTYSDPQLDSDKKLIAQSWSLPLDGSDMQWHWLRVS